MQPAADESDEEVEYLCPTGTYYVGPEFQINYCWEAEEEEEDGEVQTADADKWIAQMRQRVNQCGELSDKCVQIYNRAVGCQTYKKAVELFAAEVYGLHKQIKIMQNEIQAECIAHVQAAGGGGANSEEARMCREVAGSVRTVKTVADTFRKWLPTL